MLKRLLRNPWVTSFLAVVATLLLFAVVVAIVS